MGMLSDSFNFDNVGGKMKKLAQRLCWVGILFLWCSCAVGFIVICSYKEIRNLFWIPIFASLIGPFVIWISLWFLYAIGECFELVHVKLQKETAEKKSTKEDAEEERIAPTKEEKPEAKAFMCPHCMSYISRTDYVCPDCGKDIDWS